MHPSFLQRSLKIISIQNGIRKVGSNSHFFLLFKLSLVASKVGPRRVKLNLEDLDEDGEEVFNYLLLSPIRF